MVDTFIMYMYACGTCGPLVATFGWQDSFICAGHAVHWSAHSFMWHRLSIALVGTDIGAGHVVHFYSAHSFVRDMSIIGRHIHLCGTYCPFVLVLMGSH